MISLRFFLLPSRSWSPCTTFKREKRVDNHGNTMTNLRWNKAILGQIERYLLEGIRENSLQWSRYRRSLYTSLWSSWSSFVSSYCLSKNRLQLFHLRSVVPSDDRPDDRSQPAHFLHPINSDDNRLLTLRRPLLPYGYSYKASCSRPS